jgi:hypothetical protein
VTLTVTLTVNSAADFSEMCPVVTPSSATAIGAEKVEIPWQRLPPDISLAALSW